MSKFKERLLTKECWRLLSLVILLQITMCLYFYTRSSEAFDSYLSVLIPSFVLMTTFAMIGFCLDGNKAYIMLCLLLMAVGNSMQILVGKKTATGFITIEIAAFLFAIVGTLTCLFFQTHIKMEVQYAVYCAMVMMIYIILFVVGKEFNGTKAWIMIGPVSVQLTEVAKLVVLLCFGTVFSSKRKTNFQKLVLSGAIMILNTLGLILVHELGTAIVIYLVFMVLVLLFFENIKYFACIAGSSIACGLTGGMFLKIMDNMYKSGSQFILARYGEYLYSKLTGRIFLFRSFENDPYGKGYQMMMARKALNLCEWFHSPFDNVNIPVQEADYVFVALLLKFGLVMGILVLIILLSMNVLGLKIGVFTRKSNVLGITVAGFALSLLLSSFLTIFGSTNYFLLFGLPIVFLSAGGCSQLVSFIMVFYTIIMSGDIPPHRKSRRVFNANE